MACVWTKITQLCNQILKNSYPELIWQIIINSESPWEESETALRMPPVPSIFRSIELHSGAFQAKAVFWLRRSLSRRFRHLRNGSRGVSQVREGTRWSMDTPSPQMLLLYSYSFIQIYKYALYSKLNLGATIKSAPSSANKLFSYISRPT